MKTSQDISWRCAMRDEGETTYVQCPMTPLKQRVCCSEPSEGRVDEHKGGETADGREEVGSEREHGRGRAGQLWIAAPLIGQANPRKLWRRHVT